MHQQPIPAANLTAATAAGRALLAAGWRYDATSPMADDTTIRTLLHPTGREIHARTVDGGETTALTMTGLSLDQVAGAVLGAGLAPAAPVATRVVKGRYLAAGMTVVYEDGTRDLVTGTIRDGDDVTAVMADGVTASYHVEEGVTVLDVGTYQIAASEPAAAPDPRRIAYDLVVAGVAAGLPIPAEVGIPGHYNIFQVRVPNNDRVGADAWAAYLGLDDPEMTPPIEGANHDIYRSQMYGYPKLPGRWKAEVVAFFDVEGGAA